MITGQAVVLLIDRPDGQRRRRVDQVRSCRQVVPSEPACLHLVGHTGYGRDRVAALSDLTRCRAHSVAVLRHRRRHRDQTAAVVEERLPSCTQILAGVRAGHATLRIGEGRDDVILVAVMPMGPDDRVDGHVVQGVTVVIQAAAASVVVADVHLLLGVIRRAVVERHGAGVEAVAAVARGIIPRDDGHPIGVRRRPCGEFVALVERPLEGRVLDLGAIDPHLDGVRLRIRGLVIREVDADRGTRRVNAVSMRAGRTGHERNHAERERERAQAGEEFLEHDSGFLAEGGKIKRTEAHDDMSQCRGGSRHMGFVTGGGASCWRALYFG